MTVNTDSTAATAATPTTPAAQPTKPSSTSTSTSTCFSPTIQNRLQDAKRIIRDVTNQTLKSISTQMTQSAIIGHDVNATASANANANSVPHHALNNNKHINNEKGEENDHELDLAMALFGEVSSSNSMENRTIVNDEIQKRLSSIEVQLGLYCKENQKGVSNKNNNGSGNNSDCKLYSNDKSSESMDIDFSALIIGQSHHSNNNDTNRNCNRNSTDTELLEVALQNEATNLKLKIHFLQNCTEARIALDQLEVYSSMESAHYPSHTIMNNSSSSSYDYDSNNNAIDNGYSHTHDNNKNNNGHDEPTSTTRKNEYNQKYTHLIPMAKCLSKAQIALAQAEQYIHLLSNTVDGNSNNNNSSTNTNTTTSRDQQVANQILESIQLHIISKVADLNAKVTAIFQECIQVHPHQIVINSFSSYNKSLSSSSSSDNNLNAASSINTNTNTNVHNDPLKIAFQVLSILSEPIPSSSYSSETNEYVDKLSSRLRYIANDIKVLIIKPIIQQMRSSLAAAKKANNTSASSSNQIVFFKCQEMESSKFTSSRIGKSNVSSSRNRQQNIITLKWEQVDHSPSSNNINHEQQMKMDTITEEKTMDLSDSNNNAEDEVYNELSWWNHLLDFIQTVSTFIHKHVLFKDEQFSKIFGKSFFLDDDLIMNPYHHTQLTSINSNERNKKNEQHDHSPLMQVLITLIGDECIPNDITAKDIAKLPQIMNYLTSTTESFEKSLIEHNFIDENYVGVEITGTTITNYSKTIQLTDFCRSVITTFAEKQRLRLLTQGRSLLLNGDYHNTMRVGSNVHETKRQNKSSYYDYVIGLLNNIDDDVSTYVLHESSISVVASDLVKLCERTMDVAVNTDFSVDNDLKQLLPNMLYRSARELFDLYRAIIPATYGNEIATIPRTAAVLHNDCVYFAHRLLTLGLEYRSKFPGGESPVKCTFIDLVPTLRELADQTMINMIKYQMHQVTEIIQPRLIYLVDSLRANEAVTEWTDAEMALQGGMYHLKHLSQVWWKVLSYEIYCRTMGNLVDTLFTLPVDELMKAKDISEPACHFVYSLFRDAVNGAAEVYAMDQGMDDAKKEAARYCRVYGRIDAIRKFMNMSLSDITLNLSKGTFREITAPELSRMVLAVFENSERRQKLLHLLANNSSEGKTRIM